MLEAHRSTLADPGPPRHRHTSTRPPEDAEPTGPSPGALDDGAPTARGPGAWTLLLATLLLCLPAVPLTAQEDADRPPRLTEEMLADFEYRFIGPANPSGRITTLGVPPEEAGRTLYAGMASGGIWKTTDAGTTWSPIFNDQGTSSIGDLAVSPAAPSQVWVGTGERNSLRSNSWGDGVYLSTDGGESWEHVGLEETREIGRIALHPDDADVAYVAALGHLWGPNPERGVYRTTDGGESWEKVLFVDDTTGFVDLKMDPQNPDVLYAAAWHRLRWGGGHMEGAGAGSGIYRSTDGGESWTELTDPSLDNGLPSRSLGRIGLAVHPGQPGIVYAVIQVAHGAKSPRVSPYGGLFRSADGGETWERVNDLSAVPDYYYNEVWLNPTDPDELWLASTRLYHSTDGGRGISRVDMDRVHVDHHALWVDPEDPDHRVLGNDGGVYVTRNDGGTWEHQIIPAVQFYEVDADTTKTPYYVCGGTQDNGTWCGPTRTRERLGITEADWYHLFGGDGFHSAVSPDDPNVRYAEFQFGHLYRIHVASWEREPLQPLSEDAGAESGYPFRWDWNTPFLVSRHDPTRLYVGGNHLFRMTERGRDWEILGPDMTRQNRYRPEPEVGHTSYHSLHSVAESALDASVLWTGSNDGLLWVSTDGGETWSNVTRNLPEGGPTPPCWVSEIEPSHFDARTAFVTYDCHRRDDYRPYVFKTTDAGRSWTEITGDLPKDGSTYVIRQGHENRGLLFVGTHDGVYVSVRGGGHWVPLRGSGGEDLSGRLPTVDVRDLDLVERRNELVVGTFGRAIYVADVSPLEELTPTVLAERAHLFSVPRARQYERRNTYGSVGDDFFHTGAVAPGTTIAYYLGEDANGEVSLEIRKGSPEDGEGQVIRKLTGPGSAGLHLVTWDLKRDEPRPRRLGGPLSRQERKKVLPGEYSVSLTVGGETMTRGIVVEDGWKEEKPGAVR